MLKGHLTEAELAQMVGVSQQAVSRWHIGTARPGGQRIGKLATALNVSADEVIAQLEGDEKARSLHAEPAEDLDVTVQLQEVVRRLARLERLLGVRASTRRQSR